MTEQPRRLMDERVSLVAGGVNFYGCSRAGFGTAVLARELKLLLDAGLCDADLIGCNAVLVSHEHPDHFIALPQILTMRRLLRHPELQIMVPVEAHAEISAYLEAGQLAAARARWDYQLHAAVPGEELELSGGRVALPFAVQHSVPALGYLVYERRRKLLPELNGVPGEEIARRKATGETIAIEEQVPLLAVTGDTIAPGLRAHPDILRARVLLAECTFIDADHRQRASDTRHTHLDELLPILADSENDAIVLYHVSLRHEREELEHALDTGLPEALRAKVHVLL